jgi:hypothetical protein
MTEGEAFVYSGGGVGVFGEVGVPEAALKEGKWTRIVVTLGGAHTAATQRQRGVKGNKFSGFGSRQYEYNSYEDDGMEFGEPTSYRYAL